MKNKFIYKCFFIITFLSLMFITLFNTDVKASYEFTNNNNDPVVIFDLPEKVTNSLYYWVVTDQNGVVCGYYDCTSARFYLDSNKSLHCIDDNNNEVVCHYSWRSFNDSSWSAFSDKVIMDNLSWSYGSYDASFNIYTDNTYSNFFFQVSPLTRVMLVEENRKATIQEILGVLPLILVVVVSFLGLRKALNWLSTLLRRS